MKITLSVTKDELLALLSKATGAALTDYVIIKTPNTYFANIAAKLSGMIGMGPITEHTSFQTDKKIPAIKAMREIVPGLGLAEAKSIIENWSAWSAAAKKRNGLPTIKGDYYSGFTFA